MNIMYRNVKNEKNLYFSRGVKQTSQAIYRDVIFTILLFFRGVKPIGWMKKAIQRFTLLLFFRGVKSINFPD